MSLKTILEVEIDDSKFRKFKELFDRYQSQLKSVPGAWGQVNKETGKTKTLIDQLVEAAASQTNQSGKQATSASTLWQRCKLRKFKTI